MERAPSPARRASGMRPEACASVLRQQIDADVRDGMTTADAERVEHLERKAKVLRLTNEI